MRKKYWKANKTQNRAYRECRYADGKVESFQRESTKHRIIVES